MIDAEAFNLSANPFWAIFLELGTHWLRPWMLMAAAAPWSGLAASASSLGIAGAAGLAAHRAIKISATRISKALNAGVPMPIERGILERLSRRARACWAFCSLFAAACAGCSAASAVPFAFALWSGCLCMAALGWAVCDGIDSSRRLPESDEHREELDAEKRSQRAVRQALELDAHCRQISNKSGPIRL